MTKWAYIETGVVMWTHEIDFPRRRFGADIVANMIDCTATPGVRKGWTYDGNTFAAPPLVDVKQEKRDELKEETQAVLANAIPYDDLLFAIRDNLPSNLQTIIDPIISAGQTANQEVTNATTESEVLAVTIVWS